MPLHIDTSSCYILGFFSMLIIIKQNKMTTKQFQEKQSLMTNEELISLSRKEISKLCETGGKSIRMCVPPDVKDTDMLLCELIKRFESLTKNQQE